MNSHDTGNYVTFGVEMEMKFRIRTATFNLVYKWNLQLKKILYEIPVHKIVKVPFIYTVILYSRSVLSSIDFINSNTQFFNYCKSTGEDEEAILLNIKI